MNNLMTGVAIMIISIIFATVHIVLWNNHYKKDDPDD